MITAPAPNVRAYLATEEGRRERGAVEATFRRRWRNVLSLAVDRGHRTLVLGAWGCGAFGADPTVVASAARESIATHGFGLERIVFAIPETSRANLDAFRSVLEQDP